MASGVHAGHGTGAAGGSTALAQDPAFQDLLAQSADALGASEGEVMQAMHEAEDLYAGRTDMTEDQKLAAMMDYITDRFNASDLSNDEMMALLELCRMCLRSWQAEAAAEEGYLLQPLPTQSGMMSPLDALANMFGRPPSTQLDPAAISAPEPEYTPPPPVDEDEEP